MQSSFFIRIGIVAEVTLNLVNIPNNIRVCRTYSKCLLKTYERVQQFVFSPLELLNLQDCRYRSTGPACSARPALLYHRERAFYLGLKTAIFESLMTAHRVRFEGQNVKLV